MGANCTAEKASVPCCMKMEDGKEKETDRGTPKAKKKGKAKKDEEQPTEEPATSSSTPSGVQRSGSTLQRSGSTLKRMGSSGGLQGEEKKKTDMIRYEKNLKRMRKVALDCSGELNHFSVFLKKHYANPTEAFEGIAGSTAGTSVDMEKFVDGLHKMQFGGDAFKVFYGLCDDQAWGAHQIITKDGFVKRLGSMGNPFIQVVRQACLRDRSKIKKKVAEAMMAKNRDPEMVEAFRKFIEPLFPTPGKCFDAIAGDDGNIDEDEFVEWLNGVDFKGDAAKVFHNFCDADGYITRLAFTNILVSNNNDGESAENPQEADSGKKGKSKSEDPDSPASATPKRKGKKRTSQTGLDVAEEGGEEPDSSKKKPGRRKSLTSVDGEAGPVGGGEEPDSPKRKPARRKSQTGVQGDDGQTGEEPDSSKRKPARRKSLTSVQGDEGGGEEPESSKKKPARRNSLKSVGDEPEASAKGKAKAKAKRRNSVT